MRAPAELFRSPSLSHVLVLGAVGLAAAGCSSDNGRFGETAFTNPFESKPAYEATGSIQNQRPAPVVESRPLPAPQPAYQQTTYQAPPPPPQRHAAVPPPPPPAPRPAVAAPRSAPAYQQASYQPAAYQPAPSYQAAPPAPEYTGSVARPAAPQGNWQWDGGTAVTLGPNQTIESVSARYGVPANAILHANGLAPNPQLFPGQRIVIPRYAGTAQAAVPPAPRPQATPAAAPAPHVVSGQVHVVGTGETLALIARRYGKSVAELQSANSMRPHHSVQAGDRIVIPGGRTAKLEPAKPAAPAAAPAPAQPQLAKAEPGVPPPPQKYAAIEPTSSVNMVKPTATPSDDEAGASGAAGFRWPVRGRVVAGYGPKPTGQQNDGINISVPEGTPVKASEDGVVAYAGNELKGYGNLVLIRHANGYVTAYAHASELMVKRGDKVKRGQVIAKSGQTGNVSSPQLHFQVRKGSTPVDPMQHLGGAG